MRIAVGDIIYNICEIINPSLPVRREAVRAKGDFAPSSDSPITKPELVAFVAEFASRDPFIRLSLLEKDNSYELTLPDDQYDRFLRQVRDWACSDNLLNADGTYYIRVQKHLKRTRLNRYGSATLDEEQKFHELRVYAPSLGTLKRLFSERINFDKMDWRDLEKVIAELLEADGYDVELRGGSKDGGVDVIASKRIPQLGPVRTLWQAKHLRHGNKVGLSTIRELADVRNECKATKAIIVTSSYLTAGALKRIERDDYALGKIERPELEEWISRTLFGKAGSDSHRIALPA